MTSYKNEQQIPTTTPRTTTTTTATTQIATESTGTDCRIDMRSRGQERTTSCWTFPSTDLLQHHPSARRSVSCELRSGKGPYTVSESSFIHRTQKFQPHQVSASFPPKRIRRSASIGSLRSESSPVMRFISKQSRQLQLPSFESLGIASPSPSQLSRNLSPNPITCSNTSSSPSSIPSRPESSSPSPTSDTAAQSKMDLSYTSPLPITPPESDDSIKWNNTAPSASSSSNDNDVALEQLSTFSCTDESTIKTLSNSDPTPDKSQQPVSQIMDMNNGLPGSLSLQDRNSFEGDDGETWLHDGIITAVSLLPISKYPGEAVQLVSQTLPCPPQECPPSVTPPSAFTPIVQAIQSRLQPGQSPYINIIHAVPPKFALSNLPTSPPSTPNLLFPGDDYFNLTVFSSATAVPNIPYSNPTVSHPQTSYAPAPIVPPYSVHVAVVERYLPPTSPLEYQNLFSSTGPSVLLDRLRELSPRGGNLILIYPTKRGAQAFKRHYLAPILDPLLRQLVVVNGLSADIGMTLGHMASVNHMDEFETMQDKITDLCQTLTSRERASPSPAIPPGTKFSMVYAGKGEVQIDRDLWTEWYIQQETPRARDILNEYWRNGYRLPARNTAGTGNRTPSDREVTSPMLLREILEGIRKRSSTEPAGPDQGVELGVFVIRRSK